MDPASHLPAPASGAPEPAISEPAIPAAGPGSPFAHASEAEMSRILDFYGVAWRYEPITFPILWNLEGDVVESFSPDFYLPEFDLFLEMTTLKQRLVRKKNRKLRRLKELYPDIRIKLFYARDFRAMLLKYGRIGLVESLSGTTGQVVPDRTLAATGTLAGPVKGLAPIEIPEAVPASLEAILEASLALDAAPRRRRVRGAAEAPAGSDARTAS